MYLLAGYVFMAAASCGLVFGIGWSPLWLIIVYPLSIGAMLILFAVILFLSTRFVDVRKPCKKYNPFYWFLVDCIVQILTFFLNIKIKSDGAEKIPDGGFLVVCNHRSWFDAVVFLKILRKKRTTFVMNRKILRIPVIGRLVHKCGFLPLNTDDVRDGVRVIGEATSIIKQGDLRMCVFPEGETESNGFLPFKSGAFRIAKKAECPVVVAAVDYRGKFRKNCPRFTEIRLSVPEVIPAGTVKELSVQEIGERCFEEIRNAVLPAGNGSLAA